MIEGKAYNKYDDEPQDWMGEAKMKIGEHEVVALSNNGVRVGCQTVTRQQTQDVLRAMDEWKPAPKFEVGDYVRVRPPNGQTIAGFCAFNSGGIAGRCGKVIVTDTDIGVEFAEPYETFHSLAGRVKQHHGYQFRPEMLEKVD